MNQEWKAFVQGVTAAVVEAIAGAAFILGRRSLIDLPTILIGAIAFVLLTFKKIPEPLLILVAEVTGLLFFKGSRLEVVFKKITRGLTC